MLVCIPLRFLLPFSRLHSWKSQKRCIQLYAWPGYREIPSLSAQECSKLWSCYSSHSVLVPQGTNMLVSCSLLQVDSLVVRHWILIALFLPFLRDVSVNIILSLSWQQLRIPYINRIWICCLYVGLTELKNVVFSAMAYRTSRTLRGGNGVEPYA